MGAIFKEAEVMDLIKQVQAQSITFSRFVEILNERATGSDIICLSPVEYEREHQIKLINELTSSDQFPFQRLNALLGLATAYKDAMTAKPIERSPEHGC